MRPSQSRRHETKGRIDFVADNGQIELVALCDARPVVHTGAAQRIDADANAGAADRVEIDHTAEVGNVCTKKVMLAGGIGAPSLIERDASHVP